MTRHLIYDDGVIAVSIVQDVRNQSLQHIALRYLEPSNYHTVDNQEVVVTNQMGGKTDWFILPYTFGAEIGRKLFEQYHAGLQGFDLNGIHVLKQWLIEMEIIHDSMSY